MIDRDEVRDQIARALDSVLAAASTPIGRITPNQLADAAMAIVDPIVAERDDYRANGKEAAKVAFGVSEKLATVEAELAETHAAHRAALLGVSRPGQPTYEALEEHVAGLVQENGVLRGELDEAQRSANFWQSQAETWEREHQNTVLPYTSQLEDDRALLAWLHAEAVWQRDEAARSARDSAAYAELGWTATEQLRVALSTERESRFRWAEEAAECERRVERERFCAGMLRDAVVRELHVLADRNELSTADIHTLADHIEAGDWMEGDPGLVAAPSPPVDREALIGIIEGTDYGAGGWVSRTSTEHAATIADALISAGVVAQPPAWWKGQEIEWNSTGDTWQPGVIIAPLAPVVALIKLHDNGQRLNVETRHLRARDSSREAGQP